MDLLNQVNPRRLDDIAAAAHAAQANVVALRVAALRRAGTPDKAHQIKTPPPGPVRRMREMLIDREVVKSYSPEEIQLRLRQVWGEFCALCWLFPFVDPQDPIHFDDLPPTQSIRCPTEMMNKLDEVQRHLWRIKHEQRRRHDREAKSDPAFQREDEIALSCSVRIYGQDILHCPDKPLFCAACEYAGMLAAFRWASDDRWEWEGQGIMEVTLYAD